MTMAGEYAITLNGALLKLLGPCTVMTMLGPRQTEVWEVVSPAETQICLNEDQLEVGALVMYCMCDNCNQPDDYERKYFYESVNPDGWDIATRCNQ